VKEMDEIVHDALMHNPGPTLQYGVTEGYKPFRGALAELMSERGISIDEDNLLVTSGAQQALDLVGRLLIDPGDTILVEKPTYLGAIQAWRAYGAEFVTIDLDDDGMRTDQLEDILNWSPWPTATALPSSKMIPTASFATKAIISLLSWPWTLPTTMDLERYISEETSSTLVLSPRS